MYYIVYKITCHIDGKIYVGVHKTNNIDDSYMESGKHLKNAQCKYGIKNFSKEILAIFDNPDDMFNMESEIVDESFVNDPNTYNLTTGGKGALDYINDEIAKGNIVRPREKLVKGGHMTLESGALLRGSQKHHQLLKSDKSYRDKYKQSIKSGKPNSGFSGKTHSDKTKDKMSKSHAGKREGAKNHRFGTCWIFHPDDKISKSINKDDLPEYLNKGWVKGRKMFK